MGDYEADNSLENHRGNGKQNRLLDHHPEGVALEQEREIPEPDVVLHRFVQGRQIDGVERRVDDQSRDDQDQRQGKRKGDHRLALRKPARADPRAGGYAYVAGYDIGHKLALLLSRAGRLPSRTRRVIYPTMAWKALHPF